jgi:hypothetical protein
MDIKMKKSYKLVSDCCKAELTIICKDEDPYSEWWNCYYVCKKCGKYCNSIQVKVKNEQS